MKNIYENKKNENAPKWQRFLTMLALVIFIVSGTSFNGIAQYNVTGANLCAGQTANIGLNNSTLNSNYHLLRTVGNTPTYVTYQVGQGIPLAYGPQNATGKYEVYQYNVVTSDPLVIIENGTKQTGDVSINPLPVPTISGLNSVCANSTNTYTTELGASEYTWTITGGTGTSNSNSINVTWNNNVGTGSVQVSYVENNCTGTSVPLNVNINGVAQIVGGNIYCSIQDAIDAAANNDVINVFAGAHNENIVINKPIVLNGANANVACGSRGTETIIAPASSLPFSVTSNGVTINGFEITAPASYYAINCSNTSNTNVIFNNIHDVGTTATGANVHSIIYMVANSANTQNVTISDNCFNNISSSSLTGFSSSAIGVLQSASTGVLTNLKIERNSIENVNVNTGNWPTGKIAYGIQLNTGSANYTTTTGKIVNAQIKNNSITNLSGFIATGIALEGNTESAVVEGNTVASLTGYKLANRAGGGYDINGLKFETNRFVGTVTVQNNSFDASSFKYGTTSGLGYAVANYVPMANGGIAKLGCNWYGTANYGEIGAEYTNFTGKIFNKESAGTDFVDYSTSASVNCDGKNATPANLNVSYNAASENVMVTFDVAGNSSAIYPIPGLNPTIPAEFALIAAKYVALQTAITSANPTAIKTAALEIGDDILTEYYYMDGANKVYLKTTGGNPLAKNKYWDKYLNNTSTSLQYPSFANNRYIVPVGTYSTSTNPLTNDGNTVKNGWLAPVYGKDLIVSVTFLHNGEVTTATQSVAIPAAPVVNMNTGLGYMQIQTAINDPLTLGGHTIKVSAGTYAEHVVIDKPLDIRGPNYGINPNTGGRIAEALIVPEANLMPGDPWTEVVNIKSDNVSFDGFTVSGDNPAITGYSYAGMDLEKGQGVYSEGSNITFSNNVVENATTMGFFAGGSQSTQYQNLVVSNNKIDKIHDVGATGLGFGFYIQGTAGSITNNVVTNVRNGIEVQPYRVVKGVSTPVLQVKDNEFATYKTGIYYNYSEVGASAWSIEQNDITVSTPPVIPGAPLTWTGIRVETMYSTAAGGVLKTNTINGTGAAIGTTWSSTSGMQYAGSNSNSAQIFFSDNTVSNVQVGFKHEASANIVFTGNSLGASQKAIEVIGTFNIDATGGNTINGIATSGATTAQLFTIEDAINHKIDESTRGLVTINASELYVTPLSYAGVNTTPLIQRGIDAAGLTGWTVNVAPGTFDNSIEINKRISLIGAGSDPLIGTVITKSGGNDGAINLNASGVSGTPIQISNFCIRPIGAAGISVGLFTQATGKSVSYINFDNVKVIGTNLNPCTEQERGLYVDNTSSLTNVTFNNCAFNNLHYGWYMQKQVSADISTVSNIQVISTTFNHNNAKGIYTEKLSDATFTGCTIDENGLYNADANCSYFDPWKAGFDFNLKAGTYQNITVQNCDFTNNGKGLNGASGTAKEGVALTFKARSDGATYGANPAILTGVFVQNSIFNGNERGIRLGEPGKNNPQPLNVTITNNSFTTNVTTYTGTDGSTYGDVINAMESSNLVSATCNWWGTADGDLIPAKIAGSVSYNPWLNSADDGTGTGFQPTGSCSGSPVVIVSAIPDHMICGDTDGSILVTISGGTAPYSITPTGSGTGSTSTPTYNITGLAAGNYPITVTDANGSSVSTSAEVKYLPVANTTDGLYFATIQEAINATTTGDGEIITVCDGTYPEQLTIGKALDIRGPNYGIDAISTRGDEAIIVPPSELNSSGQREWSTTPLISLAANGIKLDGFTISGDNTIINGYSYAGMNIEAGLGVKSTGNNIQFLNNIVEKFTYMGFHSAGAQVSPHYKDLAVKHNKFENIHDLNQLGYGFAMYIQGSTGSVSNNTVLNSRTGIQIQPYQVIQSGTVTPDLSNNNFSVWRNGIYYNYAELNASAWTITQNNITTCIPPANPVGGPVLWEGISAETMRVTSNGGRIISNTINGSGATTDGVKWWNVRGLVYKGDGSYSPLISFTNNTVTNVEIGLVHSAHADIVVTGNNLNASAKTISVQHNYSSAGVEQTHGGDFNINATGGNTFNGIASSSATLLELFTIEDAINHKIDESWRGLVTIKTNELFVTPLSYAGANSTPLIQRGINAAGSTGWTVNVASGSFTEQLEIPKTLTLLGQGADITNIVSPAILPLSYTSSAANKPVIYVHNANNVVINGITLDGDGKGNSNYRFQGIAFWNAGGSVLNSKVIDVADTPFSGAQHGVGIYAFNNIPASTYNVVLNNVTVTGFQKTGVALNGTGNLTVDIDNITTIGAGLTSVTAQNGIQIWGATGTIDDCNISQIAYTGTDWTASGLLVNGPGTISADHVDIDKCQSSVYWIDADGSYKNSSITNPIMDGIYGLSNSGTHTLTVENVSAIGSDVVGSWGINPLANGGTMNMNISNCDIRDWNYGIYAYDYETNGGVLNTVAHSNYLADNTVDFATNASTTQDATCNWFGTTSASSIAGLVHGNVNYTPWLTSGLDGSGDVGFQPSAACDETAPLLTGTGFTADGVDMLGTNAAGYKLQTTNVAALDRLVQFKTGTVADETLAAEFFGLKLISSTVSAADLKAYYAARGVPEPFLGYLNDAADGLKPFVYISGTTVKLVDAAKHDIASTDVDMTIPDNYPLGTYTVEGKIRDLAGNETIVTYKLIVAGDRIAPVITLVGDASVFICQGLTYNDAGATALDDIDGNITLNIITNNPVISSTPDTYTVTYNVTDAAGNAAVPVTRTVTVKPNPTISGVTVSATSVCFGSPVTFTANGLLSETTDFVYSVAIDGGTPEVGYANGVPVSGGTATFPVSEPNVGTYAIKIISAAVNGCTTTFLANNTATFTVKPNPTISGVTVSAPSVCFGSPVTFTANGLLSESTDFVYSVAINSGTPEVGYTNGVPVSGGTATFPVSEPNVGSYAIKIISATVNGCTTTFTASNTTSFTVNPLPTATILADQTKSVCSGIPANIEVDLTGAAPWSITYTNDGAGATPVTVTNIQSSPYKIQVSPSVNTSYWVTRVADANNCSNTGTGSARIYIGPITTIGSIADACKGTITVPVTVKSFDEVGAISLTVTYNTSELVFLSGTINPIVKNQISNLTIDKISDGILKIGGYMTVLGSSLTLPDNTVLCDISFTYAGGAAEIKFDDSEDDQKCEYTFGNFIPFCDDETETVKYYIKGTISEDNIDPTAVCKAKTVSLDANGNGSIIAADIDGGSSDNCAFTLSASQTDFDCGDIGNVTVMLTVADASGNSGTCSATVTVVDNQNPSIATLAAISVNADAGVCTYASSQLTAPAASDNCSVTVSVSPASLVLGANTVTWTATDGSGNAVFSTQIVTVLDAQNPAIATLAAISVNADAGVCTYASSQLTAPAASDNCSVTVSVSPASLVLGANTVTWTATDGSGNAVFSTQIVTVLDAQNPAIATLAAISVNADAGVCAYASSQLTAPAASDNCSVTVSVSPASLVFGANTVTWTATDGSGNAVFSTQIVTVLDAQNPAIATLAAISVNADAGVCTYASNQLTAPAASDNCSVASVVASPASLVLGPNTVTWTVTDGSGRTATSTQTVTVVDAQNPTITCPTPAAAFYYANSGCTWTGTGLDAVSIADNCGTPVLSYSINSGGFVAGDADGYAFPIGTNSVTYKVTDASGNSSTCSFSVVVKGVTLTGFVNYNNPGLSVPFTPMSNTTVKLQQTGVDVYTKVTLANGSYSFTDVCPGTYQVVFSTAKPRGGINATDAGLVNLWCLSPSTIEKVNFLAGDVDGQDPEFLGGNYNITSNDAQTILNSFVSGVTFDKPWEFWKADEKVSNNPVTGPEGILEIVIPSPSVNPNVTQNFLTLVSGDFNGSFNKPDVTKAGKLQTGSIILEAGKTIPATSGKTIVLPMKVKTAMQVGAISLIMYYPANLLQIEAVYLKNQPGQPVQFKALNGELRIGWQSINPISLAANETMLTVNVTVKPGASTKPFYFTMVNDPLVELADGSYKVINNAILVIDGLQLGKRAEIEFEPKDAVSEMRMNAYPNPFNEKATVRYTLPEDGSVNLLVTGMLGNSIKVLVNQRQTAGEYQMDLDGTNLVSGVYHVTLRFKNQYGKEFMQTVRMIKR